MTVPEDFDPYEDAICPKGVWITECRAKVSHECDSRSPYCPGEICPGEIYKRTAILEHLANTVTVRVIKQCQECQEYKSA